jgi:hypothetical protein
MDMFRSIEKAVDISEGEIPAFSFSVPDDFCAASG